MFNGCSSLTNMDLSNFTFGETTKTNSMFLKCSALKSINLGNTIKTIGESAFKDCTGLTSITIPESVTSIEKSAFYNCCFLTSITIPNSVKVIGNSAFAYCQSAEFVVIGNSVETIGNQAFYGINNMSLAYIIIPASVKSIGSKAFNWCFPKEIRSFIQEPFAVDMGVSAPVLYVPLGTKAKYEATDGWKNFENIVEMGLEPVADEGEVVDFAEDSDITENTDLTGTVVNNMYYNIGIDAGGYSAEENCIVITKETSNEQMTALVGLGITDEELKENFTGIIFKLPASSGKVIVTAETTGNMTLKVKVGNDTPMEMELTGKLKMEVPYDVTEETLVYIFAGTSDEEASRGVTRTNTEQSLKIYGVKLEQPLLKGDANGDKSVDDADVAEVADHIVGKPSTSFFKKGADMNNDGVVDIVDQVLIIKQSLQKR